MAEPLLRVSDLKKYFESERFLSAGGNEAEIRAVDGVSLSVQEGETLGLVGESGCGKTTLGLTVLRLYEPTSGRIFFDGQEITALPQREMKPARRKMQMIFQDPYASLDPRMTVGQIVREPLDIHSMGGREERKTRVRDLLEMVGLSAHYVNRYPHEFSGGQRQRIGIARAIALNPRFVICDEPVSALDVSIQIQVLNLLEDLQTELKLTYMFIAHNLAVVAHISDRVGVMYLGKLIELGSTEAVCSGPAHPYTRSLLSAVLDPHHRRRGMRIRLGGDVPSPADPPSGCRFHPRCPEARPDCSEGEPEFRSIDSSRWVACHYA